MLIACLITCFVFILLFIPFYAPNHIQKTAWRTGILPLSSIGSSHLYLNIPSSLMIVTGRPSSAAIIRAGQKNTKQNICIRHTFPQIFDWFPALGWLRVSPPSLGTYGETIRMISYTFKPKMVHCIPRDHFNSSTAYTLHIT